MERNHKIRKLTHAIVLMGFLIFGLLLINYRYVVAKEFGQNPSDQPPFTGFDVIVVIDQSTSMLTNDSNYIRYDAVKSIIQFLRFNAENSKLTIKPTYRVGAVEFSLTSTLSIPLTPISPPGDKELERILSNPTKNSAQVKTIELVDPIGGTNILGAMQRATQGFDQAPKLGEDGSPLRQKRIIIFVTDGGPEGEQIVVFPDGKTQSVSAAQAFDALNSYKSNFESDAGIVAIGIDTNTPPKYWDSVAKKWQEITGTEGAFRSTSAIEVSPRMVQAVCKILTPGRNNACDYEELGQHYVPPYLKTISFNFFKYEIGATIELAEADSKKIPKNKSLADGVDYRAATQSSENFIIDNPQPGCWSSTRVGSGKVEVQKTPVFNDLLQEVQFQYTVVPFQAKLQLGSATKSGIQELADYPLSFKAVLTDPKGIAQAVSIIRSNSGYQIDTPIKAKDPGSYVLSVSAIAKPVKQLACAQNLKESDFEVFSAQFQMPVSVPEIRGLASMVKPILNYTPIKAGTIGFEFVNPENQNIVVSFPVDYPYVVKGVLYSPAGEPRQISLKRDGNKFIAGEDLVLPDTGLYSLKVSVKDLEGSDLFTGETAFEIANQIELLSPSITVPQGERLDGLKVQLKGLAMSSTGSNANGVYRAQATLIYPDGRKEEKGLKQERDTNIFVESFSAVLSEAKPYQLRIDVYNRASPGANEQLVSTSNFSITPTPDLARFELERPMTSSSRPYPLRPLSGWAPTFVQPTDFDTEVRLYAFDKPASYARYFSDSGDKLFVITIKDEAGIVKADRIPMTLRSENDGRFGAYIPNIPAGKYTAEVELVGNSRSSYPKESRIKSVVFERADPPLSPILWSVLYVLIGLALFVVMGLWAANHIFLPKAKGKLTFETTLGGQTLYTLSVTQRRINHFTVNKLPAVLNLSKIHVEYLPSKEQRGSSPTPSIQVKCYSKSKDLAASGPLVAQTGRDRIVGVGNKLETPSKEKYFIRYEA